MTDLLRLIRNARWGFPPKATGKGPQLPPVPRIDDPATFTPRFVWEATMDPRTRHVWPQRPLAEPSQVFVPVTAAGTEVLDNGGDVIARCFTPELAAQVARLLNADAGL